MPEAERAFVLICQGLFKGAALAGFFDAFGKRAKDISGDVEDCEQSSVANTPRKQHQTSGGDVGPTGSLKTNVHSVFDNDVHDDILDN